jgi:hypothetical protein
MNTDNGLGELPFLPDSVSIRVHPWLIILIGRHAFALFSLACGPYAASRQSAARVFGRIGTAHESGGLNRPV